MMRKENAAEKEKRAVELHCKQRTCFENKEKEKRAKRVIT
jgi:hypothetical protein